MTGLKTPTAGPEVTSCLFTRPVNELNLGQPTWKSRKWLEQDSNLVYNKEPKSLTSFKGAVSRNRPFARRGHVTLFLWKWKLYDFAFEKRLVGHILNKRLMIWFSNPHHFLKMSKFVAGHVTKMWFLKLWITSFWTQILHLNFKENVEKMML